MAKPLTLKQMALMATQNVVEGFQQKASEATPGHRFDTSTLRLKLHGWIELVSNITAETLLAAEAAGEWVTVDGEKYLPSNLRIIKEYRNAAAAGPLIEAHDKNKSHHIPTNKLFTPSLFPKLDYEEVRLRWVILGETKRVTVGEATPDDWNIHDKIKDDNFAGQKTAYAQEVADRKQRKALWRKHADCPTTDDLLRKLGGW